MTKMQGLLRGVQELGSRIAGRPAASQPPVPIIAERFVATAAGLAAIALPGDVFARHHGRKLRIVTATATGDLWRDVVCDGPPPDGQLRMRPLPVGSGSLLWLFVLDAEARMTDRALQRLIEDARARGERPPISLPCTGDPSAFAPEGPPFAVLSDQPDPALLPLLDQPELDPAALSPRQRAWREDGVVILPRFLPDALLDPYIAERAKLDSPGGWISGTPYEHVPEIRAICLHPPLMAALGELIGQELMLHLTLTGWISTERNWHQDDYLNPPYVNSWYAAVWMALDRIHPDSGPFEYIPGSHRWPLLRKDKVQFFLTEAEHAQQREIGYFTWPKVADRFVIPAVEREIAARGIAPKFFLAEKGDVLIWHGRLMHRGSRPKNPRLQRRALIAHYSAIDHRPDMPDRRQEYGSSWVTFGAPLY